MKENEVSELLKKEAVEMGLCAQWTGEWRSDSSQQELIDKYKRGLDFALKHDWPTSDFVDVAFDKEVLHRNLIWNNDALDIEGGNGVYILNGRCRGKMHFGWYSAATVYVRHECEVVIDVEDSAIVMVRVRDRGRVRIRCAEGAKGSVIVYGEWCEVKCEGEVRIRRK